MRRAPAIRLRRRVGLVKPAWLLISVALALWGLAPAAGAATFTILPGTAIQPVINAAANGDVIILAPGNHFQRINFAGKSLTIRSTNPESDGTVANTILHGAGGAGPMVTFENGENDKAILYGLTIRNGTGKVDGGLVSGGGLFIRNSSPTIWRCVITLNTATVGAGVYVNGGAPLLERNFIHHNIASQSGGGLRIVGNSAADIRTNLITGNRSNAHSGAGIDVLNCLANAPTIRHNVIVGNYAATKGSGVSCSSASPNVFDNIVAFNRSSAAGSGGLYSEGAGVPYWCFNDSWTNVPTNYGMGVVLCPAGSIALNPIFVDPGFWNDVNGTPANLTDDVWVDGNYHISPGSPCIDAGLWTTPWDPPWLDYAGLARLRDDRCSANTGQTVSLPVDIGSYEYIDTGVGTPRTYVGPVGGTWFLAANWSPAGIPNCSTAATIPIAMQIPAGSAVADDVFVLTGGLPSAMDIQIGGNLTANRGAVANGNSGGYVRQFGGDVRFSNTLNISVFSQIAPRPGTWELRGGTLSVTDLNAGFSSPSDGRIIQTGGACTVNGTLTLGQGPQPVPNPLGGRYELHSGTLATNTTIIGGSGSTLAGGVGLMIVDSPTASWTNSTFLAVGGSDSVGTVQISNGGDVTASGEIAIPSGEGTGTLSVNGAGSTLNAGAINISTGPVFPNGLLDVLGGGEVACTSINNGGNCGTTTTGIVGATVRVAGAGSRVDCAGVIELGGQRPSTSIVIGTKARLEANSSGVIAANQVINHPNGLIRGHLGTIDANVINMGEISPGGIGASSFGTLTIDGSLSQVGEFAPACGVTSQRSGRTIIEIGGSTSATRDVLNINGALLGGGALDVRLVGGFNPPLGSSFVIGTYQQLVQPFSLVTTTPMSSDRFLRVTYQGGALAGGSGSIVATVVPTTVLISFNPPQSINLGGLPRDMTIADFDQEDGPDVAVSVPFVGPNEQPGDVFILLNNGVSPSSGQWLGLSVASQISVGRGPVSIATGNFDGINGPDLVVANQGDDDISILRNNGQEEGGASFTRIDIPTPDQPISVASADLNGDTRDDVLYGNLGAFNAATGAITINGTITYIPSTGGGFGAPLVRPGGVRPSVIDPADVDNDRDIDVLALSTLPESFSGGPFTEGGNLTTIENSDAAGNLGSAVFYSASGAVQGMNHGDLDNDTFEDYIVGNLTGHGITYFRNAGSMLFEGGVLAPLNGDPISQVAVDFDGDGDLDIAAAVDVGAFTELQVLPNLIDGGPPNALQFGPPIVPDGDGALLVDKADVDGDQSVDLIVITDGAALAGGGGEGGGIAGGPPAFARVFVNALAACLGDTNNSGAVDADDLVNVILAWGPCPSPPAACPGDVNGSDAVNADDLITIILHWGACP